ncbi:Serine/threonine-protein kinase tel1 [Microbotryomycetes sp. JL201]|nr:Serine/threonine-protein kinase tel1 [Microbotryomycetes sp. JL201]
MGSRAWRELLETIESGKARERSQAIEDFRPTLASSHNLARLNADPKNDWTVTLQTLFGVVINERNDNAKKSTAAARKRLEDVTSLVGWTIMRIHTFLTGKGVKSTVNHLAQVLASDGAQAQYALTYLRALRCVLEYAPHVNHLQEKLWIEVVAVSFGIVLGDKIRIGQEFADDEAMELGDDGNQLRRHPFRVVDEDDVINTSGHRRTSTPVEAEAMRVLEAAFRSKSAPFLAFSRVILAKFARFLRQFGSDTTAHSPALTALNLALADLVYNEHDAVRKFGTRLWPSVLALCSTKSAPLKEQVLITLRYLLPAITADDRSDGIFVGSRTKTLLDTVLTEPTLRWRDAYSLDIEHLRFGVFDGSFSGQPFTVETFQLGPGFSDRDAAAWVTLELGADSLADIHDASDAPVNSEILSPASARNKRRKLESPLSNFLDILTKSSSPALVVAFRLQMLAFFVERHDRLLQLSTVLSILRAVEICMKHEQPSVQNWAYVVAAAVANKVGSSTPELGTTWDTLWSSCVRKVSRAGTSRLAAHAVNILLSNGLVSGSLMSASIGAFARELDVQGPDGPSDTVCLFLEWIHAEACTNMRSYHLDVGEKILAWLVNGWNPIGSANKSTTPLQQNRSNCPQLSPNGLLSLLARVCSIDFSPHGPEVALVPDCDLGTVAIQDSEMKPIQDYISGRVPTYCRGDRASASVSAKQRPATVASAIETDQKLERRISLWLQKTLTGILETAEIGADNDAEFWIGLSSDIVRRYLDLVSVSLVVEGLFVRSAKRHSKSTVGLAAKILSKLATALGMSKWSPSERAYIVAGLDPILAPVSSYSAVRLPVLLSPSHASDLPEALLSKRTDDTKSDFAIDFDGRSFSLLQCVWSSREVQHAMNEVASVLHSFVSSLLDEQKAVDMPMATQRLKEVEEQERADDFGEIRVASQASQASGATDDARAGMATTYMMMRAVISNELATSGKKTAVRIPQVVSALEDVEGKVAISIIETILAAVRDGLVTLSLSAADTILTHMGEQLLPRYAFARDERLVVLGLRFLETIAESWILPVDSGAADELFTHARQLCAWYISALHARILASWRVRLHLIAFLDVYLSFDRTQEFWDVDGIAYRASDGPAILPTAILPSMLQDVDFRVRFRAATSAPALFTFMYENALDSQVLFDDIRNNLKLLNLNEREQVMTRVLALGNIFIASGARRRSPYKALIFISEASPVLTPQVDAVLGGAAVRLGFSGRADLFRLYCQYSLFSSVTNPEQPSYSLVPIQPSTAGFANMRDVRLAEFQHIVPILAYFDALKPALDALCSTVGISKKQALLECFPQATALTLCLGAREMIHAPLKAPPSFDQVVRRAHALAEEAGAGDAHQVDELLTQYADEIAAVVLSKLHERKWDPAQPHQALSTDPDIERTFKQVLPLEAPVHLTEPNPPYLDLTVVLHVLVWLQQRHPVFNRTSALYSVLQRLLSTVRQAPFNDLRKDALFATAVAISLGHRVARDAMILDLLLHHLVEMLSQPELSPLIIGMLQWAFESFHKLGTHTADLCSHFVKATHICDKLLHQTLDQDIRKSLEAFWQHLARTSDKVLAQPNPIAIVSRLLHPHRVDPSLVPPEAVAHALAQDFAPVTKFRLARMMAEQVKLHQSTPSSTELWQLAKQVSRTELPTREECISFSDLLFMAGGTVESPGLTTLEDPVKRISDSGVNIKIDMIEVVLSFLRDPESDISFHAFETAGLLFSALSATDLNIVNKLPAHLRDIAAILASPSILRPQRLRQPSVHDLAFLEDADGDRLFADFERWISSLTKVLCDVAASKGDAFFAQAGSLAEHSVDFATKAFPIMMHAVLYEAANDINHEFRKTLSNYLSRILKGRTTSLQTIKAIVDAVVYLRHHPRPDLEESLSVCDKWLDISWLLLASGAIKTKSPLAALMFLELGHEHQGLFKEGKDSQPVKKDLDKEAQSLLYDIYEAIEEPDGFYGRQSRDVRVSVVKRLHHERQWDKAFSMHGAEFEALSTQREKSSQALSKATAGVIQSLALSGFNRLALSILQPASAEGAIRTQDVSDDLSHDLAWRATSWDLPANSPNLSASSATLYSVFRQLQGVQDSARVTDLAQGAMASEVFKLASISVNNPTPNSDVLSTILILREIHAFSIWREGGGNADVAIKALSQLPDKMGFEQADKILSSRITLLRHLQITEGADAVGDEFIPEAVTKLVNVERMCLLQLSQRARDSDNLQIALNAVTAAHRLVKHRDQANEVDAELAQVLWRQGEHGTAIELLEEVRNRRPPKVAIIHAQLGRWQVESRLKSFQEILDNCFEPASRALDDTYTTQERAMVFSSFARFADEQYQEALRAYEARREKFEAYEQHKLSEIDAIDRQLRLLHPDDPEHRSLSARELRTSKRIAEQYLEEDQRNFAAVKNKMRTMLSRAIENYARSVCEVDGNPEVVLRFTALWLANSDEEQLNAEIQTLLQAIPSHRFVFLAYQLSARLSAPTQDIRFSTALNGLVLRLCRDHPYHAFFPVNALCDSSVKSTPVSSKKVRARRSSTAVSSVEMTPNERAQAASVVISKLKSVPSMLYVVESLELVCEASREWSEFNVKIATYLEKSRIKSGPLPLPKSIKLVTDVNNLAVPVLTYDLAVNVAGEYDLKKVPTIVCYEKEWRAVGGVNTPKVTDCIGSDGKVYRQLFKGNDDMRQDAVMQQLFQLVNDFLSQDARTRRRKLHLRCYKIVPMQKATGVLEFVTNTKPLIKVIEPLYDPVQFKEAGKTMAAAANAKSNRDRLKDEAFKVILSKLPPMMRHFFFQKQRLPSLWFEMRLNYSRSVATSSIMGHVIGLGDRHTSNALVDEKLGEGKHLPIPELVPFRLTQNVIDGFGSSGVEGVFRRCSEETLRVLRSRSNVLMTVLEVFKHDPLQNWAVSAAVAKKIQDTAEDQGEAVIALDDLPDEADRALSTVKAKLDTHLSVEYTVNQLIQEATDFTHLARIFQGWKAWL